MARRWGASWKRMYGRKMLLKRCQRDQLKKDYIKQGQQYLDCWVMENGDLLTASKNKSACKLSRKNWIFRGLFTIWWIYCIFDYWQCDVHSSQNWVCDWLGQDEGKFWSSIWFGKIASSTSNKKMPAISIPEHEALFDCAVKINFEESDVDFTGMNDFSIPSLKMLTIKCTRKK